MTHITSWLLSKGLEVVNGRSKRVETDESIDERLLKFKKAYKEAFNGDPVTKEQRKVLNQSIADFIRGDTAGGL